MFQPVNEQNCYARKSQKGDGYNYQCPNKKKLPTNYCGKHISCSNPFFTPEPTIVDINKVKDTLVEKVKELELKISEQIILDKKEKPRNIPDYDKYQNQTDFYNLESIQDIPLEYLYEYFEKESNQYFAFDIRTLRDYIQSCNELEGIHNPYTQLSFPKEILLDLEKKHKKLVKYDKIVDYKETVEFTKEQELEWRTLGIFQKINELGHYVEYRWFLELTIFELKRMYRELEDLWNYRIYFTKEQKEKILGNYVPFINYTVANFDSIKYIDHCRKILLDEIEKFISSGKLEGKNGNDNKYTGSILVLTALVEVSKKARNGLPHLIPII